MLPTSPIAAPRSASSFAGLQMMRGGLADVDLSALARAERTTTRIRERYDLLRFIHREAAATIRIEANDTSGASGDGLTTRRCSRCCGDWRRRGADETYDSGLELAATSAREERRYRLTVRRHKEWKRRNNAGLLVEVSAVEDGAGGATTLSYAFTDAEVRDLFRRCAREDGGDVGGAGGASAERIGAIVAASMSDCVCMRDGLLSATTRPP